MQGARFIAAGVNEYTKEEILVETKSPQALRDLPEKEIEALVLSLNSLHEGELGIAMLVACGERAIPPLRRFLMEGKSSGIFVPRQRAVRALAELGAKDVLLDYIRVDRSIPDPVAAQGEEAVKNTAARALSAWPTDDVYEVLRGILHHHRLIGAIETLGEFRRPEAVPELVAALQDDFCRSSAEDALRKLGEVPHSALVDAARSPEPSGTRENHSSRSRRSSALRLLESSRLVAEDWRQLAALMYDQDPEIAARVCAIALAVGDLADQRHAVKRLIEVLPKSNWLLQGEIQEWLEKYVAIALPGIQEEIDRRRSSSTAAQAGDHVLRMLLAVRRKAQGPGK
jgi:HEAT repeat protein